MQRLPGKECCSSRPLWVDGDGLPLVTGFSAARRLTGFYEGTAAFINAAISLILYGLMGYEVYEQVHNTKSVQVLPVLEIIWNGDSQSIKGVLSFFASPEYATYSRYCLAIFALPLLWGLQESFSFARVNLRETRDTLKKALQTVRNFSLPENKSGFFSNLWKNNIRWMLPYYGIESAVDYLLYSLLMDGNLPIQDRKVAFGALIDFAKNVPGHAKLKGLETLEKIAHGISLKQFDIIEQNYGKAYKEALLTEKAWALDELKQYNPGFRKAGVKGFFTNLYAHYLLWKMGDFGHPISVATLTLYKVGKLALTINFMVQIGKQIAEFLYCPNPLKQGVNAAMQPTSGYSTYNQQCFNAYLSVFNRIPNQPACTLVNLMPNFNLNASNFTLFNLSGAGVTGEQVAGLLMGLRQYQPNVHLTHFDLSNNVINTESGMTALFEAFKNITQSAPSGQGIRVLNLSNNNIGLTDDFSTVVLGTNLTYLPQLKILDLSGNVMGSQGDEGTQAMGKNLQYLTELQTLDLSGNQIGKAGDIGAQAMGESLQYLTGLQTLDLSQNYIGYNGDVGTQAIGESLQYLSQLQNLGLSSNQIGIYGDTVVQVIGKHLFYLINLQTLDLSGNDIGNYGDEGTQDIGKSLQYLPHLQTLDLSWNWIGHYGDIGTQIIGESLKYLPQLQSLDLSQNYMASGFTNITSGILSLDNLKSLYVQQGYEISLPPSQLTLLKQFWNHRNSNTDVYELITAQDVQDYLNSLSNTTQIINLSRKVPDPSAAAVLTLLLQGLKCFPGIHTLDLSENNIRQDGTQVIAEGLQYLPQLQNLDLSGNIIGLQGAQAFGEAFQYLTQLQTLDLSGNEIGHSTANATIAIGESLRYLTQLQNLDLSGNAIGGSVPDTGTQAVGESLKYLTQLRNLDLSQNQISEIDDIGAQIIGENLQYLIQLRNLDFSQNYIGSTGDEGIQAIGENLKYLTNLQTLDLSQNELGHNWDNGTIAIGKNLQYLPQLRMLSLAQNGIGQWTDVGTQVIGENLQYLTNLQTLDLSQNAIGSQGDDGTQAIGESLQYLTGLQTLDLSYNFIGSQENTGIQAIGESLPSLTNLQILDLSHNAIDSVGIQNLFTVLPQLICHAPNLTALNLQYNNFTNISWNQAASALEGQYSGQIHQACEANRCFGTPITQNQTAIQCNAMQNLNNQLIPLEENCPIPIAGASSLSPSLILSFFMMSQRSGASLVLLSLWLLTLNLFSDHP